METMQILFGHTVGEGGDLYFAQQDLIHIHIVIFNCIPVHF